MTKKQDIASLELRTVILGVLVALIIGLSLIVHKEQVTKQKTIQFNVNGWHDVYIGNDYKIQNIYCDVESESCYWQVDGNCKGKPINYQWKSNVVGDSDSNYLTFSGNGYCTVVKEKLVWRLRFD